MRPVLVSAHIEVCHPWHWLANLFRNGLRQAVKVLEGNVLQVVGLSPPFGKRFVVAGEQHPLTLLAQSPRLFNGEHGLARPCAAGDERSRLGLNELQYRELLEGELPELVFLLLEVGSEVRAQEPVWSELAGDGFNAFGARRLLPLPLIVLEDALDRGLDAVRLCIT